MPRIGLLMAIGLIAIALPPWGDFQGHTHWSNIGWIPFVSPPIRFRDIVANVLLFVPLGVAMRWNVPRRAIGASIALAIVLSFTGEAMQLYSHTRFPSATDLVTNCLGATAGAVLSRRWAQGLAGSREEWSRS